MIDSVAFTLGPLTIRWYGIMAACGFASASWMIFHLRCKVKNLTEDRAGTILFLAMICGLAGARIFYVVQFYSQEFAGHPWIWMLRIDRGGLVFYGGFILATAAVLIYSHCHKLDTLRLLDIFSPALALAHGFGRVGCFLTGCCFGRPGDVPWAVTYPVQSAAWRLYGTAALHPVQLYEAIENFLFAAVLYILVRKCRPGTAVGCYLLIYGILRFFNDSFRGDGDKWFGLLTPGQTVSILLILSGSILLLTLWYKRRKNDGKTA